MKLSKRVQACELSPMRKFHPFAVEAQAKGRKIYHLNIGQPDIATPEVYFDAVRNFASPVLAYANLPACPPTWQQYRHITIASAPIMTKARSSPPPAALRR